MTMRIALTVDGRPYCAEAPLGATLRQYLEMVGHDCQAGSLLSDGRRPLSLDLELAYRFRDAQLTSVVPDQLMAEVGALTPDELLVLADRS